MSTFSVRPHKQQPMSAPSFDGRHEVKVRFVIEIKDGVMTTEDFAASPIGDACLDLHEMILSAAKAGDVISESDTDGIRRKPEPPPGEQHKQRLGGRT